MKKKQIRLDSEAKTGLLFATPFIIGMLVFNALPFLTSLYFSFTNYNMQSKADFLGLKNYIIMFTNDSVFWKSFGNTLIHICIAVPMNLIFSVAIALLLNNKVKGIHTYRIIFYLPNVVSLVAMSLLWVWLFQPSYGLLNQVLKPIYKLFNMEPILWLADPKMSKFSLAFMSMWTTGSAILIYLAQLQDIPKDLYEAASIDGAGAFSRMKNITLPLMTPAIFYNTVMAIIAGFQTFQHAMIMTNGGPAKSTYYYAYYLYDKAFKDGQMGYASAMAWFLLIVTLTITMIYFGLSKKWVFYMSGDND